ncbi:hypothetical protein B0O99DRAFT_326611 [Bisporella sp. PMI_857]|nr:hypothetical protein B0O99DRAFT_366369 [Bisporella sp. PMI_857]KAH8600462.1 hypothetical protein B0O99DRAFT_326611 [Bisporella sp. PMI_857]
MNNGVATLVLRYLNRPHSQFSIHSSPPLQSFAWFFEQDLSATTLLAVPELYMQGQRNEAFNFKKYFGWMFMATCEAMIIWFIGQELWGNAIFNKDGSLLGLGQIGFSASIMFINIKLLILEFHNITIIPIVGFFVTAGGWWLWTGVLSVIFKPNKDYLLYPMLSAFVTHHGRDLTWWLVLLLILSCLTLFELMVSSIRKTFWPTDTDVFQELQKDPVIRRRFEEAVDCGSNSAPELEIGNGKSSAELREGEIQALLNRPRVMDGAADPLGEPKKRNTIDAEAEAIELRARYPETGKRKISTDVRDV